MARFDPTSRNRPPRPAQLSGQYIVRFNSEAVTDLASSPVRRSATAVMAVAAMPDEVAGPLDVLKREAGMLSVSPLFVTAAKVPKSPPA